MADDDPFIPVSQHHLTDDERAAVEATWEAVGAYCDHRQAQIHAVMISYDSWIHATPEGAMLRMWQALAERETMSDDANRADANRADANRDDANRAGEQLVAYIAPRWWPYNLSRNNKNTCLLTALWTVIADLDKPTYLRIMGRGDAKGRRWLKTRGRGRAARKVKYPPDGLPLDYALRWVVAETIKRARTDLAAERPELARGGLGDPASWRDEIAIYDCETPQERSQFVRRVRLPDSQAVLEWLLNQARASPRQREIALYVYKGLSLTETAQTLGIARTQVDNQARRLNAKLNALGAQMKRLAIV